MAATLSGDPYTGDIVLSAMKRCLPLERPDSEVSLNDRVGGLILTRVAYHLSDPDLDQELRILFVVFVSIYGPSTGLREPKKSYAIELMDQLSRPN